MFNQTQLSENEIATVYDKLGLTSASDRARFSPLEPPRRTLRMDVVISTTSQPFRG